MKSSGVLAMMTFKDGPQNSYSACRQTPQGAVTSSFTSPILAPTTAMSVKRVTPWLTAVNRAVRSAQLVGVKAAFSMLQPVNTCPSALRRAAPTVNRL